MRGFERKDRAVIRVALGALFVASMALPPSGCSTTTALVISGESLKLASSQFLATADMMDVALDHKTLSVEEYRKWKAFGGRFAMLYGTAVELWKAARLVNDADTERRVAVIIGQLAAELEEFYQLVMKLQAFDGGS